MRDTFDITIIGAGLVGASLALAIAQGDAGKKIRIRVIDSSEASELFAGENFDPRVVALTQASQNFLTELGIWSEIIQQRACAYSQMHVWDGEGTSSIHFDAAEVGSAHLGHIVENSVALNALQKKLAEYSNIDFVRSASLIALHQHESSIELELANGERLLTQLLVGADGAQSRVRDLANFGTREWNYGHKALVTTVQTEMPHQFTAWQRFMHTGPLAFLPLPDVNGKHFCSIVWSAEENLADQLMAMNDQKFCGTLASAFEHKLGRILHSSQRFVYPLRQRHAKDYIQPQIVLVGDAAHNIHPLAGQGVNLGFLDANVLACEISRAQQRGLPLSDFSILRRYQRQRKSHNLGMMTAMEGFKQLFAHRSLTVNWLRNVGMNKLDSLSAIKKLIIQQAMGM
jgi:2-polyprenylphenol 6-hydroxylase